MSSNDSGSTSDENPATTNPEVSPDPPSPEAPAPEHHAEAKSTPAWQRPGFLIPVGLVATLLGLVFYAGSVHLDTMAKHHSDGRHQGHHYAMHGKHSARCPSGPARTGVLGQPVTLSRVTVTAAPATFVQNVTPNDVAGYLVVPVTLQNTLDKSLQYRSTSWTLQTPEGRVLTPADTGAFELGDGGLIAQGKATAPLHFAVGTEKGEYRLSYGGAPCPGQVSWTIPI